jgi:hypothetical protein
MNHQMPEAQQQILYQALDQVIQQDLIRGEMDTTQILMPPE